MLVLSLLVPCFYSSLEAIWCLSWNVSVSLFAVGFYMTLMTSPNHTQTEVAELLTPSFDSALEICVHFWWVRSCHHTHVCTAVCCDIVLSVLLLYLLRYWIPAGSGILGVDVLRSGEEGEALWERSGPPSSNWELAEVTVSSPGKFRVRRFFINPLLTLPIKLSLSQWVTKLHNWINEFVLVCFLKQFISLTRLCLRQTMCQAPTPQWN